MKNILIIGGSYFAGRVFVETLTGLSGYAVSVFNRGNIPIQIKGVEHIRGDREIGEHISRRIPNKPWDAVIDFCAYTPEHISDMLNGLAGDVHHYILISTTSVYAHSEDRPIYEDAPKVEAPQPELGAFAEYGFNKWRAECALKQACGQKNIACTVLRPAIIYGRYNYARRESYFFDAVLTGKPLIVPGNAPALFSFVWVDDLAELIARCIERNDARYCAYNVAGPEAVAYADLIDIVAKVCGRNLLVKKMALKQILKDNVPIPFPPDIHLHYDGCRIAEEKGFNYTPLETGLRRTWHDYKALHQAKQTRDQRFA